MNALFGGGGSVGSVSLPFCSIPPPATSTSIGIHVTVRDENDLWMRVIREQPIWAQVCGGLGIDKGTLEKIQWGGGDIGYAHTCETLGIEEGAKITVTIGPMPTKREDVDRIVDDMPHFPFPREQIATYEGDSLVNFVVPSNVNALPNSVCELCLAGDLDIIYTKLTSLPHNFGSIRVGRNLRLINNNLTSLPVSFGEQCVPGDLVLRNNRLESLPDSFGNIKVGGDLVLHSNELKSLPASFGDIQVAGGLVLHSNKLESLPASFGNIQVGGGVDLSGNQLGSLPEGLGVKGDLNLRDNKLKSLPVRIQVCGNMAIGGNELDLTSPSTWHGASGVGQWKPGMVRES